MYESVHRSILIIAPEWKYLRCLPLIKWINCGVFLQWYTVSVRINHKKQQASFMVFGESHTGVRLVRFCLSEIKKQTKFIRGVQSQNSGDLRGEL